MTATVRNMSRVLEMLGHLKAHLRITSNDLDSELTQKLLASVAAAEHHIGKTIIPSTVTDTHKFASSFTLRAPVIALESVAVDGVVLSPEDYELNGQVLDIKGSGSRVVIKYESGYQPVPADMMAAILLHASSLFNNPLDSVEALPKASDSLLRPYRSWGVVDNGE